jgi:ABC-2 type transport system permease protein
MNGLMSVIKKEFMHLRRDSATLRIAIVLPMLQLILFGYAINFDIRHIQHGGICPDPG